MCERSTDKKRPQSGKIDLSDTGYSPAARKAIRRRLADEPDEGPEEEDFNRAVRRSAEERDPTGSGE